MIRIGRKLIGTRGLLAALAACSLLPVGCNKTQTSQEALNSQLETLHIQKEPVAPFAGTVNVDGQPPAPKRGKAMLVILYDKDHPDKNKPPRYIACGKDGKFAFYTYTTGDGVPVGSYIVLFAELTASRQKGMVQPDDLKNLYDDPDKNAQNKDFVITVASPGKTDYYFNLEVAGKDAATPGPHAVTELRKE